MAEYLDLSVPADQVTEVRAAIRDILGVPVEVGSHHPAAAVRGELEAAAQVVLMLPVAALAAVELADRLGLSAAVGALKARLTGRGVAVRLTGRGPVDMDAVDPPDLLDEADLLPDWRPVYDLFLAYASPDVERVARLHAALEDRGLRVFRDRTGVQVGQDWPFAIQNAQRLSRATAVCLSAHTPGAQYLRGEIQRALRWRRTRGHLLLPVGLDGVPPVDDLPEGMQTIQVLDLPAAGGVDAAAELLAARIPRRGAP